MGAAGQGAGKDGRWLASPRTLCFVIHTNFVLLMRRGPNTRIFPNKYNGLGGHVERDEDVFTSAARELEEECGLAVRDLRMRGIHHIDAGAESGILMFVFTAQADTRELTVETDEGALEWVRIDQLGAYDLVDDVHEVLSRVLAMPDDAAPYFAHVSYDADDKIMIRYA